MNNERHGFGILWRKLKSNSTEQIKDKRHASKMSFNCEIYEGLWKNDQREGNGKLYLATLLPHEKLQSEKGYAERVLIYDGNWTKDKKHGNGRQCYLNGDVFEGNFENNQPSGFGKMCYKSTGDIYEGEWQRGVRHGSGQLSRANGDTFKGNFADNKKNGQGELIFKNDGMIYEGFWSKDVAQKGIVTIPNFKFRE
ncbi:MAG: hypothetical protein MHMPM18_002611 [Marteilia pararefringens]